MKKLLILGLVAIGMSSCSKETLDSAGRDVAQNIIRSYKWTDVVRVVKVTGKEEVRDTLVSKKTENSYLEFKKDGYAYIYKDGQSTSATYDMPTSRSMNYGGIPYIIKENIIQTTLKFTLENVTEATTTTIEFKR